MKYGAISALAGALMLLGAGGAVAVTPEEQDQLITLLENAVDASDELEIGSATVTADGALALPAAQACEFNRILNGDDDPCSLSAIVIPPDGSGINSIYYYPAEEIGHVDMEEWTDDVNSEIDALWDSYVEGTKEQGKRLGEEVVPLRWVLYPTLDKERGIMTYGILISFGGDETINLIAVKFTRKGYALMRLITDDEMLATASADLASITAYASETYLPATGLKYADFTAGDHVAEIGAVGVLASVMGVKYASNKGTLAALGAALLIFAKKAWFLVLAIPVALWAGFKKLFRRS